MNRITVAVTSWVRYPSRLKYLQHSLDLCRERLDLSGLEVQYLVSHETDNVDDARRTEAEKICSDRGYRSIWHTRKADLGANLNHLLDNVTTEVVFYIQDDYAPEVRVEGIAADVEYLMTHQDIGIIRYPYHSGFCLPEWPQIDQTPYLALPRSMPYYYSDCPQLQHRRWRQQAGRYAEYVGPTMSEHEMGKQAAECPLKIITRNLPAAFGHFGTVSTVPEKWGAEPECQ